MCSCKARSIAFFSNHYWASERRAGFHGLAQAFSDGGWTVRFVTTGLSRLSFLKTDSRLSRLQSVPRNHWIRAADGTEIFVYCPPVHPFARRPGTDLITDDLFARFYRNGLPERFWGAVEDCEVAVFESSAALLLFDKVRRRLPRAKLVYRVSDDVRVIGMSRSILTAENDAVSQFDLVSVPSRLLLSRRFGRLGNARFHPHGLDLARLEAARSGVKAELARPNCVALGTTLFNTELLGLCARARPDVRFYIVGAVPPKLRFELPNVVWCGERPFEEALRMAAACDVAAAFYRAEEGTEYLAETSNKIAQYTYFGKAIIGPAHLAEPLRSASFIPIEPATEEGAAAAVGRALRIDPPAPPPGTFRTWPEVRDEVLVEIGLASRGVA